MAQEIGCDNEAVWEAGVQILSQPEHRGHVHVPGPLEGLGEDHNIEKHSQVKYKSGVLEFTNLSKGFLGKCITQESLFLAFIAAVVLSRINSWLSNCVHRIPENQSAEVTFIILGFSEYPNLQVPLFLVFLTIYTVTVLGNLGMIIIIRINPKLHTPMYFFLSHLSFVDFCYSTAVTPKLLENLFVKDRTISFTGCIMQYFFACTFVETETFMLAVMAYDRFVAVCNPLLYTVVMSQRLSSLLVGASYSWSIVCSLTFTSFLLTSTFHGTNFINNFFCEYAAIVAISCSDTYISQEITLVFATFNEISTLVIILTSYVLIFITVMKMPSRGGHHKALSTCASHLTSITIFHGTIIFLYCVPNSKSSRLTSKVASVFYMVVIPMLNPLIYSFRNKEVKETIRKLINTKLLSYKLY
ncbi:olfactory receptor 5D18-like [Tupaia chinensis]|uniref:olfactory receptor 5D18-like n=1 Tax=Tupaia chinensis TaxID=246437 RepID=UPI000FFC3715|nr:olfactory receptor 5D18-like [Tupaia chinensis]